jgi:hypothetical protein
MAVNSRWTVGDIPRLKAVFTDPDTGANIDPAAVSLIVKRPAAISVVYIAADLDHPSLGVFEFPLPLLVKGTYRWRWTGANGDEQGAAKEGALDAVSSF